MTLELILDNLEHAPSGSNGTRSVPAVVPAELTLGRAVAVIRGAMFENQVTPFPLGTPASVVLILSQRSRSAWREVRGMATRRKSPYLQPQSLVTRMSAALVCDTQQSGL